MQLTLLKKITPIIVTGFIAVAGTLLAPQLSWAEGKKSEKHSRKDDHEHGKGKKHDSKSHQNEGERTSGHFGDRERTVILDYYKEEFSSGHCPPGLAKKHNGCMPPGVAKKWKIGQALPRDVVVYELPSSVIVKLGPPPLGHRYVRVAEDILLIAEGTGMIMDAIEDLTR